MSEHFYAFVFIVVSSRVYTSDFANVYQISEQYSLCDITAMPCISRYDFATDVLLIRTTVAEP